MTHGQPPHIQRVIPCDCGSKDVYWHGDTEIPPGRVYCCDVCWGKQKMSNAPLDSCHVYGLEID